jgi:hypothetical protein
MPSALKLNAHRRREASSLRKRASSRPQFFSFDFLQFAFGSLHRRVRSSASPMQFLSPSVEVAEAHNQRPTKAIRWMQSSPDSEGVPSEGCLRSFFCK